MLCDLARDFPPFVARFLEHGLTLRRRFREETITDLLMGALITAAGRKLIVEFPDEPQTGADMEWNFVAPQSGTFFRLVIQAKQVYGDGKVWSRHCYRELYHKSGVGSQLQSETLCDTARHSLATYPLYIFYNSASTVDLARSGGCHQIEGVNIADGFEIERLVISAKGRALRTGNRSLKAISPLFAPLTSLLCPATILPITPMAYSGRTMPLAIAQGVGGRPVLGTLTPPDPQTIRDRIARIRQGVADGMAASLQDSKSPVDLPEVPAVADNIPDEIQILLERGATKPSGLSSGLDRWRLTFISV